MKSSPGGHNTVARNRTRINAASMTKNLRADAFFERMLNRTGEICRDTAEAWTEFKEHDAQMRHARSVERAERAEESRRRAESRANGPRPEAEAVKKLEKMAREGVQAYHETSDVVAKARAERAAAKAAAWKR